MEKFITQIYLSLMFLCTTNGVLGQNMSLRGDPNIPIESTYIFDFENSYVDSFVCLVRAGTNNISITGLNTSFGNTASYNLCFTHKFSTITNHKFLS